METVSRPRGRRSRRCHSAGRSDASPDRPRRARRGAVALAGVLLAMQAPALPAADPVEVEEYASAAQVRPGDTFQVALRLAMKPGWHVQSHRPSEKTYIATVFTLEPAEGLEVGAVRYPEGDILEAPALGGSLSVYSDGVILGARVRVLPETPPGGRSVTGSIRYQACNDRTCLFPRTVQVSFPIRVDPEAPASASPLHPEIFAALAAQGDGSAPAARDAPGGGSIAAEIRQRGFSLWLLGVFALGLGLNLTPCVYPVIAVTISYFGQEGGGAAGRTVRSAAYTAGIMGMFTALFLAAGLSGQLFGSWLQNRWLLAGLALVLVVLALSSFGLFQIQAPLWLRNRAAGRRHGIPGAVLMGLAMGVVAAPCVGPLIAGLLIWVGQQGDVANAGLVGATLSAGLALPYFILGVFSGSLRALPRSGEWMEWVERLMGFVLLGVALYFLSPFLPRAWLLPLLAALVLLAGAYLAFVDRAGRAVRGLRLARGIVFAAALVGAALLVRLERAEGIRWQPYAPAEVTRAASEGHPVMIEFTADWCVPCRVMEYGAFKNPAVIEESGRFVRLRVDLTHHGDPAASEAVQRFDVAGPPVIVFLGPDGLEVPGLRVRESMDAEELLFRMQQVPGTRSAARTEDPVPTS